MVTVTGVLRRSSTVNFLENGGSSGESSRRPSVVDAPSSRRPSLAGLSLRLSSRSKKSNATRDADASAGVAAQRLGEAFFSLPEEIIIQVLCHLSLPDIFALRLTSRTIYSFLQVNACPITRSLLKQCAYDHTPYTIEMNDPDGRAEYTYDYLSRLYPQPLPSSSMDYLLQMLKRQNQVDKMLAVTMQYLQMRIYMIPGCPRFEDFRPYKMKLTRRMHLAAWTIYHFLEKYRDMLVHEHPKHLHFGQSTATDQQPGHEDRNVSSCPSCAELVKSLLSTYPATELIPAYHFYDLCRQHIRGLSRAPTYAGTIERRLRGWSRKSPTDIDLAQYVIFGGIPELSKLSMLKGSYTSRIELIGAFNDKVSSAPTTKRVAVGGSKPGSAHASQAEGSTITPASFYNLTSTLQPPLAAVSYETLSAVPDLEHFIIDSDEWVTTMFELVKAEDQIVSALGFVQNILAGKKEPDPPSRRAEDRRDNQRIEDGDFDFLAPVKGFE
ncbi:hypothetical protein PV11_02116 [Exophiala sideris]|uniref:F-box domain-containing protein n=1 Tax=Exophiala sideris TaxID=1016849 RepID=A0A0D1XER1_9EURO|nr:hypothetical protein PV11_02116 [Exophiala sideris]